MAANAEFTRRFWLASWQDKNEPQATRGKAQNKRPACALSAIFVAGVPSTRGATAPQRAQRVNFVLGSVLPANLAGAMDGGCDGGLPSFSVFT